MLTAVQSAQMAQKDQQNAVTLPQGLVQGNVRTLRGREGESWGDIAGFEGRVQVVAS